MYFFHLQVKSPESKKPKQLSPVASSGAGASESTEEAAESDATSNSVRHGEANGSDPALEKARAAFQRLQASVVENAQVCMLFSCTSLVASLCCNLKIPHFSEGCVRIDLAGNNRVMVSGPDSITIVYAA